MNNYNFNDQRKYPKFLTPKRKNARTPRRKLEKVEEDPEMESIKSSDEEDLDLYNVCVDDAGANKKKKHPLDEMKEEEKKEDVEEDIFLSVVPGPPPPPPPPPREENEEHAKNPRIKDIIEDDSNWQSLSSSVPVHHTNRVDKVDFSEERDEEGEYREDLHLRIPSPRDDDYPSRRNHHHTKHNKRMSGETIYSYDDDENSNKEKKKEEMHLKKIPLEYREDTANNFNSNNHHRHNNNRNRHYQRYERSDDSDSDSNPHISSRENERNKTKNIITLKKPEHRISHKEEEREKERKKEKESTMYCLPSGDDYENEYEENHNRTNRNKRNCHHEYEYDYDYDSDSDSYHHSNSRKNEGSKDKSRTMVKESEYRMNHKEKEKEKEKVKNGTKYFLPGGDKSESDNEDNNNIISRNINPKENTKKHHGKVLVNNKSEDSYNDYDDDERSRNIKKIKCIYPNNNNMNDNQSIRSCDENIGSSDSGDGRIKEKEKEKDDTVFFLPCGDKSESDNEENNNNNNRNETHTVKGSVKKIKLENVKNPENENGRIKDKEKIGNCYLPCDDDDDDDDDDDENNIKNKEHIQNLNNNINSPKPQPTTIKPNNNNNNNSRQNNYRQRNSQNAECRTSKRTPRIQSPPPPPPPPTPPKDDENDDEFVYTNNDFRRENITRIDGRYKRSKSCSTLLDIMNNQSNDFSPNYRSNTYSNNYRYRNNNNYKKKEDIDYGELYKVKPPTFRKPSLSLPTNPSSYYPKPKSSRNSKNKIVPYGHDAEVDVMSPSSTVSHNRSRVPSNRYKSDPIRYNEMVITPESTPSVTHHKSRTNSNKRNSQNINNSNKNNRNNSNNKVITPNYETTRISKNNKPKNQSFNDDSMNFTNDDAADDDSFVRCGICILM